MRPPAPRVPVHRRCGEAPHDLEGVRELHDLFAERLALLALRRRKPGDAINLVP